MTKEEARKIAVGIAKLPGLLRRLARDRAASAFHWANNLIEEFEVRRSNTGFGLRYGAEFYQFPDNEAGFFSNIM